MRTLAVFLVICGMSCLAQQSAPEPAFEVASVRLSDPGSNNSGQGIQTSARMLTIRHSALFACIMFAYQMPAQVIGPDWLHDVKLDIVAKAATPAGDQELYLMLGTLLRDRMGLEAHFEKREMPVFALTVTDGPPVRAQDKGAIVFQRFSVDEFATMFSKMFGRPIVNATGLKERYDLRIDLAALRAANPEDSMDEVDTARTTMQDQLGLKLEDRKQTIDVLVVDHAEKTPTEN
jgi:uncharacterized protein (TIGR03435 family)